MFKQGKVEKKWMEKGARVCGLVAGCSLLLYSLSPFYVVLSGAGSGKKALLVRFAVN